MPDYSISLTPGVEKRVKRWLLAGVLALALAGLFAGIMVSVRPLFYSALIVHVDLSILVWFLSIACMLWQMQSDGRIPLLDITAFGCFLVGMLCLPLSVLVGGGIPLLNNYIPIIVHPLFFIGLSLILCGVLFCLVSFLFSKSAMRSGLVPYIGLLSAGLIILAACMSFGLAQHDIPSVIVGEQYYELLFWGGGHLLQFAHTQLVMLVWLWLASILGLPIPLKPKHVVLIYMIGVIAACISPLGHLYETTSWQYREFFTHLMRYGNAPAPLIVGVAVIRAYFKAGGGHSDKAVRMSLLYSILLFGVGGMVGYLIQGSDVRVPAHYHGSIVGITLAYMGLAYALLPRFGYASVTQWRIAIWQPVIYATGQCCWIAGMFILGAEGLARKQNAIPEAASSMERLGAFLKHGGDGLSLMGGLLFVVVVLRAVWKRPISHAT